MRRPLPPRWPAPQRTQASRSCGCSRREAGWPPRGRRGSSGPSRRRWAPSAASACPCSTMPSASSAVTSSDTSPATSVRISFHTASGAACSRATRRRVRRHAAEHPPPVDRADLLDAGGIEEQFHALRPSVRAGPRRVHLLGGLRRGLVHHQVDHGGDRLIEAVVRDHGNPVRQRLALHVALEPADAVEPLGVAGGGAGGDGVLASGEVRPVPLLVVDPDDEGYREDAVAVRLRRRRTPAPRGRPRSRCWCPRSPRVRSGR